MSKAEARRRRMSVITQEEKMGLEYEKVDYGLGIEF